LCRGRESLSCITKDEREFRCIEVVTIVDIILDIVRTLCPLREGNAWRIRCVDGSIDQVLIE
jgi:hypothetical protein